MSQKLIFLNLHCRKGEEKILVANGKYKKITTYNVMENIAAAALSELSAKAVVRTGVDATTQTVPNTKARKRNKVNIRLVQGVFSINEHRFASI
ncbi:unnamed protein product [Nesidiocoris tenuis]|uniref:Uncharacterized protein n=1 Tax=Nesidiocoris tenuis TaxID=355587 RepID=A0A6H5HIE0_9HEMI|nr:unnamed protein product [Nesidiocoris tenuis]